MQQVESGDLHHSDAGAVHGLRAAGIRYRATGA
jgi:hypothetical protein